MHSTLVLTTLFAALALASPIKRDVVVENEVVTATVVVTVTAGQGAATPAPEPVVVVVPQRNEFFAPQQQDAPAVDTPPPAPEQQDDAPAPAQEKAQEQPAKQAQVQERPVQEETSGPAGTDFKSLAIFHHNVHRANHSAPALEWSDSLASTAQKIANTCIYKHNTEMDGGGYGQNIAAGNGPEKIGNVISDQFYNGEVGIYANLGLFGKNPNLSDEGTRFHDWGHFSQIVWKSATKFGCAVKQCGVLRDASGNDMANNNIPPFYTVCNYDVGNMGGAFASNVLPPLNKAVVRGSDTS